MSAPNTLNPAVDDEALMIVQAHPTGVYTIFKNSKVRELDITFLLSHATYNSNEAWLDNASLALACRGWGPGA